MTIPLAHDSPIFRRQLTHSRTLSRAFKPAWTCFFPAPCVPPATTVRKHVFPRMVGDLHVRHGTQAEREEFVIRGKELEYPCGALRAFFRGEPRDLTQVFAAPVWMRVWEGCGLVSASESVRVGVVGFREGRLVERTQEEEEHPFVGEVEHEEVRGHDRCRGGLDDEILAQLLAPGSEIVPDLQ